VSDNYDSKDDEFSVLGQAAVTLLPTMFKFVTETHAAVVKGQKSKDEESMNVDESNASDSAMLSYQQLQIVTEAISALARLAPRDFLYGLFKKVMHRLLEEIQSETCDHERVCALLSLSQALVSSEVLDETNISFLYRALKTMIKNDEHGPRVQKRAYKVLAEICQHYHSYVIQADQLNELMTLLTGSVMTSQVAARHMRLKCINIIVDGMDTTISEPMVSSFLFHRPSFPYVF
jgi:ribosomal RNA-processing protein 12